MASKNARYVLKGKGRLVDMNGASHRRTFTRDRKSPQPTDYLVERTSRYSSSTIRKLTAERGIHRQR